MGGYNSHRLSVCLSVCLCLSVCYVKSVSTKFYVCMSVCRIYTTQPSKNYKYCTLKCAIRYLKRYLKFDHMTASQIRDWFTYLESGHVIEL